MEITILFFFNGRGWGKGEGGTTLIGAQLEVFESPGMFVPPQTAVMLKTRSVCSYESQQPPDASTFSWHLCQLCI